METRTAERRGWRADALALVLVLVGFAVAYADFATQLFYSDDFVFLCYARDFGWDWFWQNAVQFQDGEDWPYWRPGLHLVFRGLYLLFGAEPAGWMVFGASLHLVAIGAVYGVARAAGSGPAGAALGAGFLIAAPAVQETVSWTCSAIGVLPSTLLACGAGWIYVLALERHSRALWGAAIASAALSLAFREMAYHLPLFVFGAHLAHRRSASWQTLRGAAVDALPFGLLTLPHFAWLNRIDVDQMPSGDVLTQMGSVEASFLRNALGLDLGDLPLLALAAVALVAAMWATNPRARVLAVWAAVATFPYVAKIYADRHAYLLHAALGAAMPAVLASWAGPRRALRVAGLAVVALAVVQGAVRLPRAQARQREAGQLCADVLAWCREVRIERFDHLCPDFVPPALENGWASMLDLGGGGQPGVVASSTFPWPPFQILLLGDLPPDAERAAFLRYDHQGRGYSIVPRDEVFAGRIPVPLVGLVSEYEVVDAAAARMRAEGGGVDLRRRALLHRSPAIDLGRAAADDGSRIVRYGGWPGLRVVVEIASPRLLTVFVPAGIAPAGIEVAVDGEPVEAIPANGIFWAIPLEPGARLVEVQVRT